VKRRAFIVFLASAAVSSVSAAVQQPSPRRLGVLINLADTDPEGQARIAAFRTSLEVLGWKLDDDLVIDYRWPAGEIEDVRASASELARLVPDVLLASGTTAFVAIQEQTRTVPIVFVNVGEETAMRFTGGLARPTGNATGFAAIAIHEKYLEALKEIAPSIDRVGVITDPENPAGPRGIRAIETMAKLLNVQVAAYAVRRADDIKRAVEALSGEPRKAGLIVLPSPMAAVHRDQIVNLVRQHRLPAVYPYRYFTAIGGLLSYGVDLIDQHRRAASYIDRILRGQTPASLPVQEPPKLDVVINLTTAKALGLTVPPSLLARADELIE